MGAAGTSNVAGGTSGVASAFSSIYNNFKKFCCEFLRQEIVQVLHKVIVQVFLAGCFLSLFLLLLLLLFFFLVCLFVFQKQCVRL